MMDKTKKRVITYNYHDGSVVMPGDYIRFADENFMPYGKAYKVYECEGVDTIGLGVDATNPVWIENGRARPCEYGIYPFGITDRFVKVSEEEGKQDEPKCKKDYDKHIEIKLCFDYSDMELFTLTPLWKTISGIIDAKDTIEWSARVVDETQKETE